MREVLSDGQWHRLDEFVAKLGSMIRPERAHSRLLMQYKIIDVNLSGDLQQQLWRGQRLVIYDRLRVMRGVERRGEKGSYEYRMLSGQPREISDADAPPRLAINGSRANARRILADHGWHHVYSIMRQMEGAYEPEVVARLGRKRFGPMADLVPEAVRSWYGMRRLVGATLSAIGCESRGRTMAEYRLPKGVFMRRSRAKR